MRYIATLLAFVLALGPALVRADDTQTWYTQQNPTNTGLNSIGINQRVGVGSAELDMLNQTSSFYTNLSAVPTGASWNVQITPTAGTFGSVWQPGVVSTLPLPAPSSEPTPDPNQIPAISQKIERHGIVSSPSVALGPLTPPGAAGQSIIYL